MSAATKESRPGRGLLWEGLATFAWYRGVEDIRASFRRSVYREIFEDLAFQRLSRISFLGAIDYALPCSRQFRRESRSRFQHSVGVASLALRFAQLAQLSERDEQLIVVAALLHDIGHAPLSHSLETVFKSHFGINHHEAGAKVIRGESPLGKGILSAVRSNGVDPDEVIALLSGEHSGVLVHLFASPMNIDTFDGILRCQLYLRLNVMLTPELLVDSLLSPDLATEIRFDSFWRTKHRTYEYLINSVKGILADGLSRKYMLENIDGFAASDYFLCENQLMRKHPELVGLLRRAKKLLASASTEEVGYKKRSFFTESKHRIRNYSDLYGRYLQRRTDGRIRVPDALVETPKSHQHCLFDVACEQ